MAYDDGNFSAKHSVPQGAAGQRHRVTGTGIWRPDWGTLVSGAKTMTVDVQVGTGSEQQADASQSGYEIKGRNPSEAQIGARASSRWYVRRLIRKESSCLQFVDGYPHKSDDNGYGLMQITNPAPTEADLWRWRTNIDTGKSIIDKKHKVADDWWAEQKRQWEAYNKDRDPDVGPPPDKSYGDVTFGYSSGKPFTDGIAIKAYNGAVRHWLSWYNLTDQTPYWKYNESGYVEALVLSPDCQ